MTAEEYKKLIIEKLEARLKELGMPEFPDFDGGYYSGITDVIEIIKDTNEIPIQM